MSADHAGDLAKALEDIHDDLKCRGEDDNSHYCPNCDNSLYRPLHIAATALARYRERMAQGGDGAGASEQPGKERPL